MHLRTENREIQTLQFPPSPILRNPAIDMTHTIRRSLTITLYLALISAALYLAGNLLIFPGPTICLGWPDDTRPSWVCLP